MKCGYSLEPPAVLTGVHDLLFLSKNKKNIKTFHLKKFALACKCNDQIINPLVINGISHPYHLDDYTFSFRGIRNEFSFLFHFSMKIS